MTQPDLTYSGGIARVVLGPGWRASTDASELRSTWRLLQQDADVAGVAVIAPSEGSDGEPAEQPPSDQDGLGPKTNGLLKPFGVGIAGPVRDEILQLVAEADAVLATPDATLADTSLRHGMFPVHAFALRAVLPGPEALRIGLFAGLEAMSSDRALQLELVNAVVSDDQLEPELLRRLRLLVPQ